MSALITKVKSLMNKNPKFTAQQIAELAGTTAGYVNNLKLRFRDDGELAKFDPNSRRKPDVKQQADKKELVIVSEDEFKAKVKGLFKKKNVHTLDDLTDFLDCGKSKVKTAIQELIDLGHNFKIENDYVVFSNIIPKSEAVNLEVLPAKNGFHKFGAIGDNHMGSRYERQDVLEAMYDHYQREDVKVVYNTGNWIDGEARFNVNDLNVHGLDRQINHFVKNYPQRPGITTYFIGGDDHEGWYTQKLGMDIGKHAERKAREAGRNDLIYIGYMEADIVIPAKNGRTTLRVLHPGGGSSYAISYTVQKIIESYQGGEKPDILLIGHYHKAEYIYCRGVHAVQTGTTQDQSPFMRKKRLAAHLGGWIIEFASDDNGAVTRFKQEFFPFYDNAYYQKWEYKN